MKYVLSLILVCTVLLFVNQSPSLQYTEKNDVFQPDSSTSKAIALKKGVNNEPGIAGQAALLVVE